MRVPGLRYESPNTFTPKQRLVLALGPPVGTALFKAVLATCRVEERNRHYLDDALADGGRAIIGIWHEAMALAAWTYRGRNYHTMTSYSFDGEMAARVVHCFGLEAVRGSSSRGGVNALYQITKALKLVGCVGFTLDGPRGPRRVAKPGVAMLAARTGVPVVPHAVALSACRRLKSWDRFPLPRPFCRFINAYGPPIPPPPAAGREDVEAHRLRIETALNDLHRGLETELGADPLLDG